MCLQVWYPETLLRSVLRWREARWWETRWREARWRETKWRETLRSLLLPALLHQQLLLPMVLLHTLLLLLLLLQLHCIMLCLQISPRPLHSSIWLLAASLWSRGWHPAGLLVEEELCLIVSRGKGTGL